MLIDYFKETHGVEVIETTGAFLCFKIFQDQFFISDFFIAPEFRKSGKHFLLIMRKAFKQAAEKGCKEFSCHIHKSLPQFNEVLFIRLKFGFRVVTMDSEKIGMILPLQECKWVEEQSSVT